MSHGLNTVLRNLNLAVSKKKIGTTRGLIKASVLVERDAKKMTPVDTSNLINSFYRDVNPSEPSVVLGYTADYAVYVHEMTDEKIGKKVQWKKPGAQAKFLETALKNNKVRIIKTIESEAKKT